MSTSEFRVKIVYGTVYPCCVHCEGDPICLKAPDSHLCHCDKGCQSVSDTIEAYK